MPARFTFHRALAVLSLLIANGAMAGYYEGQVRRFETEDETLLQKGRWEAVANLAGVVVTSTVTPAVGPSVEQSTSYLNPGIALGRMLTDTVETRLLASYLQIDTSTGGNVSQNSKGVLVGVQGLWHKPLALAFAFYAGGGGLFFYGSTRRPVDAGATVANSTLGLGVQGLAGLLMQPGARLTMRLGLRVDLLFQREAALNQTARDLQGTLEYAVGFRF